MYQAPEVLSESGWNASADIYSLGVMLAVLVTGFLPDSFAGSRDELDYVQTFHVQLCRRCARQPAVVQALINDMLHPTPTARLTAAHVVDAVVAVQELLLEETPTKPQECALM